MLLTSSFSLPSSHQALHQAQNRQINPQGNNSTSNFFPPLVWRTFDITQHGTEFEWAWSLDTEDSIAWYVPQYSADNENYRDAGKIPALESGHSYNYRMPINLSGTVYFRIKEIDMNGKIDYSPVKPVQSAQSASIVIFPSPATTEINLQWPYEDATSITTMIANSQGKVMIQQKNMLSTPIRISLQGLTEGTYYLYAVDDKQHRSETRAFSKLPI